MKNDGYNDKKLVILHHRMDKPIVIVTLNEQYGKQKKANDIQDDSLTDVGVVFHANYG